MKKSKILVLEGIDGAGKSTQIKFIKEYFESKNLVVKHLHFPMYGHNEFSEVIAKFLRGEFGNIDEVNPLFVSNIYAMDRYLFLPELMEIINSCDILLLDRYVFSNIAFQCAKLKDEIGDFLIKNWILKFEFDFLKLPYPDLTLFLDVPIDITKNRLKNREKDDRDYLQGKKDIHEADLTFQEKVRKIYLSLKGQPNYHIIKCAEVSGDFGDTHWNVYSPEYLFETYKNKLKNLLD